MKRPWRVVAALFAVVVVALAALPFLLPLEVFRAPIESAASRVTGRAVAIRGPLHLTLFPELAISAADVSIANAPGARDADLADIGALVVGVRLVPLLSGRLDVTKLVLDRPVVHLEIAKNGEPNWKLTAGQTEAAPNAREAAISNFTFAKLRIDGGRITYFNADTNKSLAVENVGLDVERTSGPLGLKGSLDYNGEKLNLDVSAANSERFLKDLGSAVSGTVTSPLFAATFSGNFRVRGNSTGSLEIHGGSLRKLLAWAGYGLGQGNNYASFALATEFDDQNKRVSLQNLRASFDNVMLSGNLLLDRRSQVMGVSGEATINGFDLDSYLAGDKKKTRADPSKNGSTNPIDLAALKSVNADVKLTLARLVAAEMSIDHANLALKLSDGLLVADIGDLSLYSGGGNANFAIDAREETPKFRHALHLTELQMRPFLKDLAGVNFIDGKGTLDLDVNSQGGNGRAIWAALGGKASLSVKDGTVHGVDLAAVSRLVQNLVITEILSVTGDKAETKFSEMGGSFAIANGVAHNKDFHLVSPILTIAANGDINLANRTLDVHLAPKGMRGLPIPDVGLPFIISGSWDHLHYGADVKGLATSIMRGVTESPIETIKNPGKTLKSILGLGK